MVNVTDIHSLTEFQRHAKSLIQKVKESKSPLVLAVNGRLAVVVQDAAMYQALVERLLEMEDLAAIRYSGRRSERARCPYHTIDGETGNAGVGRSRRTTHGHHSRVPGDLQTA